MEAVSRTPVVRVSGQTLDFLRGLFCGRSLDVRRGSVFRTTGQVTIVSTRDIQRLRTQGRTTRFVQAPKTSVAGCTQSEKERY
ncbi:unnamed protein product [Arctia plantaginis]|uniref:Uncharacterized protein n=1 Tax=Arctia plantaginis TaxID=874455 RepID=A0A8S1ASM9_ARCPL|nr:unnamed protein product [Arctia plantaginis]CAB3253125.1 unnamed protein product [Arctia plantaginis]